MACWKKPFLVSVQLENIDDGATSPPHSPPDAVRENDFVGFGRLWRAVFCRKKLLETQVSCLRETSMQYSSQAYLMMMMLLLLVGCSSTTNNYENRPFFLAEEDIATHGRKSWFDRMIESDPGVTDFTVAADYQEHPPLRIAVLPFIDHGKGEYTVDKISLSFSKSEAELNRSAWTRANRVRRSVSGELGGREFDIVPLVAIDAVLADQEIDDWNKLLSVRPQEFGRWLGADAIVYGEILDYEAYWAGLISVWRVAARIKMVSTFDGHELFRAQSHRYSVDVAPAVDPIDICINSAMTAIDLRDIKLARTESEVGREIVMRLPIPQRNITNLQEEALENERSAILKVTHQVNRDELHRRTSNLLMTRIVPTLPLHPQRPSGSRPNALRTASSIDSMPD
jgi:hypothetical protein